MIRVQTEDIDVTSELERLRAGGRSVGAIASFIGLMRDINDGDDVSVLELEHYAGMTERSLAQIVEQASDRWPIEDATVVHRVGRFEPGDSIVLVAVASRHRGAAFEACEFIMDFLKTRAPFWKKETTHDGATRWVDARSSDDQAVERWRHPGEAACDDAKAPPGGGASSGLKS